ncbi:hypothetical protein WMY93_018207 [Mugilogobius chulae]|uniref:Kinesin-like protein n=1 Tax=Mugilogobius chulae TaxID=88201 RepID=A0AAW0NJG4_9GOBI
MASVRVAVRVRPLDEREKNVSSKVIVEVKADTITIYKPVSLSNRGEEPKIFSFDFSFDSTDPNSSSFASQEKIYKELGSSVIKAAFEGFNSCIFAYGQTGSGKSYTMMGQKGDKGLIPRICEGLFQQIAENSKSAESFHMEVSFLEIYNERVHDLLQMKSAPTDKNCLKVREHPKEGPYVQNLTRHLVQSYSDVEELMLLGDSNRTTASTEMNDTSSRSHAIFTVQFTRAWFENSLPCETVSKIHLVDLAGSERADATRATGTRLKEGANINKSLVTLGCVISTLVLFQNIVTTKRKKQIFIPYRDSVLTWLLKDSLGGNSKTTMIATVSPAEVNYAETLSTLLYASRAKNIVNSPKVNEDNNVKVIRGLRAEIDKLRKLLEEATQVPKGEPCSCAEVEEKLYENEAKVEAAMTKEWSSKWAESDNILKEETVALRKRRSGVFLDCQFPHLIGIDDDLLGSGIILYYLKDGQTTIGSNEVLCGQDIVLQGPGILGEHCELLNQDGAVTLTPHDGALCLVNGSVVTAPCQLTQGSVIQLGKDTMFRFNHPTEAALLERDGSHEILFPPAYYVCLLCTYLTQLCSPAGVSLRRQKHCFETDVEAHQGGARTRDNAEKKRDQCHKSGPELTSEGLWRGAGDAGCGGEVRSGDASLQKTTVPGRGDGCGTRPVGSANEIQEVMAHCNEGRPDSDGNSLSSVSHLQSAEGGESTPVPQQGSALNSHSEFDKTPLSSETVHCPTNEVSTREHAFYREMDEVRGQRGSRKWGQKLSPE